MHAYNAFHGEVRAAYTFDAGPNAVIYHLEEHSAELLALLLRFYPAPEPGARCVGNPKTSIDTYLYIYFEVYVIYRYQFLLRTFSFLLVHWGRGWGGW